MGLALGTRQDLFDVIQTADQAGTEIEPVGLECLPLPFWRLRRVKARTKHLVQDRLEGGATLLPLVFQPDGYVVIERQGCAHDSMLST